MKKHERERERKKVRGREWEGVGISDLYDALYDINDNNMSADSDDVDGKGEQNLIY